MARDEKPFAKDYLGRGVFLAESKKVNSAKSNIDRLLLMIGKYMGWGKDISHVWVSDLSSMGDFHIGKKALGEISGKLGFKVKDSDLLHKVARRMAEGGEDHRNET